MTTFKGEKVTTREQWEKVRAPELLAEFTREEYGRRPVERPKTLSFAAAEPDAVMMDGKAVSRASVKEAHRVLRPEGLLLFSVPAKTKKQDGYTLPDIYAIVREGFNIVGLVRPVWWRFWDNAVLTIHALKKNWKAQGGTFRPYV
jgi:SAM-dependent methyltransferase